MALLNSEFDAYSIMTVMLSTLYVLPILLLAIVDLCFLGQMNALAEIILCGVVSILTTLYTVQLNPRHGEIIVLVFLTLVQLTIWAEFFVRVVLIETKPWPLRVVATLSLSYAFGHLLFILHWYLRRFLGLGLDRGHRPTGVGTDEDEPLESYSDENALVEPYRDNSDALPESYSDGLLGLAYREQLEAMRQMAGSSKTDPSGNNDTDDEDPNSQLQYHYDNMKSPSTSANPPATTSKCWGGPSTVPKVAPPPSPQDLLQSWEQGSHFRPLAFEPRFRWQEKVPGRFYRDMVSISLGAGIYYLVMQAAILYMRQRNCKMKIIL